MADSFREDDSYIPLFAQPPPPFAHNRGNLLGRPVLRAPAAGQPRPVPRRDGGGGGGGGALDSVLRVLGAPPLAVAARSPPGPWAGHRFLDASSVASLPPSSRSSIRITELALDDGVAERVESAPVARTAPPFHGGRWAP